MANNGLAKLAGAPFTRIQPGLCGTCKFYSCNPGNGGWDVCEAKQKLLSNPHAIKGNCKQYEDAGKQVASSEIINEWVQLATDHQEYLKRRKAGK